MQQSKQSLSLVLATGFLLAACASSPVATMDDPPPPAAVTDAPTADDALLQTIQGSHRSADHQARDRFRHPYETLQFFGIKPDHCVVELWPGGGWYAEILAPYLKDNGHYIAGHFYLQSNIRSAEPYLNSRRKFDQWVSSTPELFGRAEVVDFQPTESVGLPDDGRVDMVLTFRNAHNWMKDGVLEQGLAAVYTALKPGGVFGVVDHRADPQAPIDPQARNGYVNQADFIEQAKAVGFRLEASSEINANPKDTANHPNGVWTLPPRLRVPDDEDPGKYLAIGESDRMTLKFFKPAD